MDAYLAEICAAVIAMGDPAPLVDAMRRATMVFVIGNGGSAGIASHVAADLAKHGIAATSLAEPPTLTMLANDYGYETVYARQIESRCRVGDLVIVISSSGMSENLAWAASAAKARNALVATLTGFHLGNAVRYGNAGGLNFFAPSDKYGVVEMAHQIFLHAATDRLAEKRKEAVA